MFPRSPFFCLLIRHPAGPIEFATHLLFQQCIIMRQFLRRPTPTDTHPQSPGSTPQGSCSLACILCTHLDLSATAKVTAIHSSPNSDSRVTSILFSIRLGGPFFGGRSCFGMPLLIEPRPGNETNFDHSPSSFSSSLCRNSLLIRARFLSLSFRV